MSAQSIPRLITVEEFEKIPDPLGGRYELRHGEAVFVTFAAVRHKVRQRRLRVLLEEILIPLGFIVDVEYPYRPLPENEVWGADVLCFMADREQITDKCLRGSPELVIEVKSPSNTKAELIDKAMTTLAGAGAREFWVVDDKTRTVTVYSTTAGMHIYSGEDAVPLPIAPVKIRLADIFAD